MTVQSGNPQVAYWEIHGRLEFKPARPDGSDVVVLSNIHGGAEASPPARGLSVRYVARGCENYRIGARPARLEAGHIMIASHELGAEAEASRAERSGTLGLCTLIHLPRDEMAWAQVPLVMSAASGKLGPLLHRNAIDLWNAPAGKTDMAERLIAELRTDLQEIGKQVIAQAAAVAAAKPSTRFEMVRRAYLAQAYLHSTIDRAVSLDEVSTAVATSPFRLLAAFQQCFGESPAAYHRRLRLKLAAEEARRRKVPIATVADEFGFAGGSSFSHAYRRAFGYSPVWTKRA